MDLREDPGRGIEIVGASLIEATERSDVVSMLRIGNKNRTMESTSANDVSSRSHAVFILNLELKEKVYQEKQKIISAKLLMIDLAGSERAQYTNNKGIRMLEGANINKSLLALGNCINALCEGQKEGAKDRNVYVPYRDSKLTRLLKDSLGGNCKTFMVASINPALTAYEDTLNT